MSEFHTRKTGPALQVYLPVTLCAGTRHGAPHL